MRITPWLLLDILIMIIVAFGAMILYNLANIYYLKKYNISKWIPLALSVVLIILTQILTNQGYAWYICILPFFIGIFFLSMFFDLHRNRNAKSKKEEKKIVIKPKAKPNRVKKANTDPTRSEENPTLTNSTKRTVKGKKE